MEHNGADVDATAVRQHHFDCEGPSEISVEFDSGRLDVRLTERIGDAETVTVRVQPDPTKGPWTAGISGLLSWLGEQALAGQPDELATQSVRNTTIDFTGQRLTVRAPRDVPLRTVPLLIEVSAPAGSSITARSGSADITVDGVADRFEASTGSGQIRARQCTSGADLRSGSGDVRLGSVAGMLRVRTGSGVVDVGSSEATERSKGIVQTSSGNIRFAKLAGDMTARSGSGDLDVVDARAGRLELTSGSGQIRVGIHPGVWAELDVSSGSGQVRSDLPVGGPPAEHTAGLRVKARTGSGDALVTTAAGASG